MKNPLLHYAVLPACAAYIIGALAPFPLTTLLMFVVGAWCAIIEINIRKRAVRDHEEMYR